MRKETIAAIATGLTDSGIGIIRISGEDAVSVGNSIFCLPSGKKGLEKAESHRLYYGFAIDTGRNKNSSGDWKNLIIDEVMAVVMKAPRSFTGEDTVEIQCHGGVLVMQKILALALKNGARIAEPGEFTKRAFLNGRMDLTRAEAVIDVIHSQNEYALSASVNQLKGNLSSEIKKLRADIIYEIAFIESALDDPEHISLDGYSKRLSEKLKDGIDQIESLLATADNGKWIKEGINTVITGKPNVGKSSLLNLLVGKERAIVSEIAGTTRDVIQETVKLGEIVFNVVDTAGIHSSKNEIERIGIERAKKYTENADLVVFVVDSSVELDEDDREIISTIQNKKVIVLLNKSDLNHVVTEEALKKEFGENRQNAMIKTSTLAGIGLEEFEETVKNMFFQGEIKCNSEIVITNMRHKEALQEALVSLKLVQKSLEDDLPEDFYSIDLMNAYSALGRIIGEAVEDDLVEEIFKKFCMGK